MKQEDGQITRSILVQLLFASWLLSVQSSQGEGSIKLHSKKLGLDKLTGVKDLRIVDIFSTNLTPM